MSLVEMQSALARLYVDEAFFAGFCAEPQEALSGYDLTPREASAIAGIDRDAIEKFADSLRLKTRGRFRHAYRLLMALDAAAFDKYYRRFYELRPIQPYESFHGPIVELGRFLERSFRVNRELPPFAADLARYERLFFEARFQPRAAIAARAEPATAEELEGLDAGSRLSVAPGVRIERFGYDMGALEEALLADEIPQEVPDEPCQVVFMALPPVGRAKKFQVSASTVELLSLCNGERELGEVAACLAADWETVLEAARKLYRPGLLERRAPG